MTSPSMLVLGGTRFVGRAVVDAARAAGWEVTVFTRGNAPVHRRDVTALRGDRTTLADLEPLRSGRWDAVVDTWAEDPWVVRDSARALASCAGTYVYVSSRAVHAEPMPAGMREDAPTVPGSPDASSQGYALDKRGGEIAVQQAFGERSLILRAGLILGPHEEPERLPVWLRRAAAGGEIDAPGPPDQPFRALDVRDLAEWLLRALCADVHGVFLLVNPEGHATTRSFLESCVTVTGSGARLVWRSWDAIQAAGIDRYDAYPGWVPPGPQLAGLIHTDTTRATQVGWACRPLSETIADTWSTLIPTGRPC